MDYVQLLNEVKMSDDYEAQQIARSYGVNLSITEIRALRPLLNEISFTWVFTGIPENFIRKVSQAIGAEKAEMLFSMYLDAKK
ncbi:hypothetical protein [Sporosarcina sp. G11-34]|uniref:hypothetical protein n=1 Tax=Sporosarcina sp. G11-34 TaxID=2849605 RepID=UPI0022A9E8BD|nr:hypothetical protein [Sporosarcina sp. G11-34]MCZ2259339.1 hypothetical protein [Sporosarcina sp. G11-34]